MTTENGKRWVDDGARPAVRSLLESAALDEPTAAQLESLTRRLAPQLSGPAGGGGGGGASGGASLAVKGGAVLVVTGLVTAAFVAGRQTRPPVEPPSAVAPAVPSVPVPSAAVPVAVPPTPIVPSPPPAPAVPPPSVGPKVARPPLPPPTPAPAPPPAPVGAAEDADLELLQRAMSSQSAEVKLSLAEEHLARFPKSALAQEREVLAIDALVRLGRRDEARTRLGRFARQWPTSAHLVRLEHLLAP
jgi:hypothetical protein